jgi:hypothetical protein
VRPKIVLAAILVIAASILTGLSYLLLEAPAATERSIHFYYGVSAGVVILICQVAGLVELLRGDPGFIRWIVPAALYLLLIGLIGGFKFGNTLPLAADSGRAVVLLGVSYAAFARMRRRT